MKDPVVCAVMKLRKSVMRFLQAMRLGLYLAPPSIGIDVELRVEHLVAHLVE